MFDLDVVAADMAWPLVIALAWSAGELSHRWIGLPRISVYGLVGFAFGNIVFDAPTMPDSSSLLLLANIAFGLILFEFGYRVNILWLRANPWIAASSVVEAALTFVVVYGISVAFGTPPLIAVLLAALAMSTSPAAILRVVNEERSSGAVTERVIHFSALNCAAAALVFNLAIGVSSLQPSGIALEAIWASLLVLIVSPFLGALFGVAVPSFLRRMSNPDTDATLALAISVIVLVAATYAMKLSPLLATLTFGIVTRHRRVVLSPTRRNFGSLGNLLTVLLFVFVAARMDDMRVIEGLGLGLVLVVARFLTKTFGVAVFAPVSGISYRKGILAGLALAPISAFVVLVLEQTRLIGIDLANQLAPMTAATLLLEIVGPIITQIALRRSNEAREF